MNDFSAPYRQYLLICALVQWFDAELLHALDIGDRRDIDILLASDAVEPADQISQMYRLRDEARAEALEWIRTHSHFDELAIHMRAFDAFLTRMRSPADDDRVKEEEQCFYHLDKIFFLATPRGEWQTISHAIAQARSAEPLSIKHLHRLVFYDGSVAIQAQEYERAETLLSTLLQQPELDSEVRVRVLNGLALSYMYQNTYDRALKLYEQVYALAG